MAVEKVGGDAFYLGKLAVGEGVDVETVGEVDGAHVGDEACAHVCLLYTSDAADDNVRV